MLRSFSLCNTLWIEMNIIEYINANQFTNIVNGLEALGKTYKESEKLPMEELVGSLMTYEINLAKKLQEGEDKKKKSIALKSTTKEEEEVEEEKQSEEDDDLTLITRKLNKYMRVKGLEEEGSPLEETFLKRNLHLMVTKRNEKRKEIWCVSNARNSDTLNMIILSTKVKPRGE
ncbi:hypothetical protein AAG906_006516 [Vitis piasezkii]